MLKKYNKIIDRLHDYMTEHSKENRLEIHHSHIDTNKLFNTRLISFLYLTGIYIWVLNDMTAITTNFIYLTLHGYTITWLYYAVVLQDYFLVKYFGKQKNICPKLKHYVQIIYETAVCFEFPITLVFWGFLFPILLRQKASMYDIVMNTNLHLGPIVVLLIDFYYNTFSFPKRHLWVLVIYGTGYMAINLAYSLGVKVIYEPIDWKSILSYSLVVGSYVFVCAAHYFGRFAHKKWKAPKLKHRITEGLIQEIDVKPFQNSNPSQKSNKNTPNPYPSDSTRDYPVSDKVNNQLTKKQNDILL